ncbi:MAG: UbiA family prenyltransferase [Candidatus Hodarchaeales archaeon]
MEEYVELESLKEKIITSFFKLRLYIGILFAVPYLLFGFLVELALLNWELDVMINSLLRLIFAVIISLFLLPFIWMTNDYFDAPYDSLDPKKRNRNIFCSKKFTNNPYSGYLILFLPFGISLVFSFMLGLEIFLLTILIALMGFFYSAPPIRFKEVPVADLITHGFYVGGFFFLLGGTVITPLSSLLTQQPPLFLVFLLLAIVDMSGIQYNSQLIDIEVDSKSKQRTTSLWVGKRYSILILRGLVGLILSCLPLYLFLIFNSSIYNFSLLHIFPDIVIQLIFVLSLGGIFLYFWDTRGGFKNIDKIQKRSVWLRHLFIYPFALIGVLLINTPFL